nr:translation initiation factor IF-2-like [Macaca fascicularis]
MAGGDVTPCLQRGTLKHRQASYPKANRETPEPIKPSALPSTPEAPVSGLICKRADELAGWRPQHHDVQGQCGPGQPPRDLTLGFPVTSIDIHDPPWRHGRLWGSSPPNCAAEETERLTGVEPDPGRDPGQDELRVGGLPRTQKRERVTPSIQGCPVARLGKQQPPGARPRHVVASRPTFPPERTPGEGSRDAPAGGRRRPSRLRGPEPCPERAAGSRADGPPRACTKRRAPPPRAGAEETDLAVRAAPARRAEGSGRARPRAQARPRRRQLGARAGPTGSRGGTAQWERSPRRGRALACPEAARGLGGGGCDRAGGLGR